MKGSTSTFRRRTTHAHVYSYVRALREQDRGGGPGLLAPLRGPPSSLSPSLEQLPILSAKFPRKTGVFKTGWQHIGTGLTMDLTSRTDKENHTVDRCCAAEVCFIVARAKCKDGETRSSGPAAGPPRGRSRLLAARAPKSGPDLLMSRSLNART